MNYAGVRLNLCLLLFVSIELTDHGIKNGQDGIKFWSNFFIINRLKWKIEMLRIQFWIIDFAMTNIISILW